MHGSVWLPPNTRRGIAGVIVAVVGPLIVAVPLSATDAELPGMYYVLAVALAAAIGRLAAGLIAALVSVAFINVEVLESPGSVSTTLSSIVVAVAFLTIALGIARLVASRDAAKDAAEAAQAEAERLAGRLEILARAGGVLGASLDYRETLSSLADVVVPALADWYSVHLVSETGAIENVHVAHQDPDRVALAEELWRTYPPIDPEANEGVALVVRTGQPQVIPHVTEEMVTVALQDTFPELIPVLIELQLRSVMIVPLATHGQVFGALQLVAAESGRTYTDDDLSVAMEIADRAAIAIENARAYDEQFRAASFLQHRLLPKSLPDVPHLSIAARYLPSPGALVGGDFYDVFPIADGLWKAVIGDVCGKGTKAASLMGFVRFTARAVSREHVRPSEALVILNEALAEELHDEEAGVFCTACVVRINPGPDGARLTIAVAGHPLPLLVRPDGEVTEVGAPGTLLGVFPEVDITNTVVDLLPGDSLVMLTDGALEATRDDSWTEAELRAVLSASAGSSAATIVKELEEALLGLPNRREDDTAILVLQVPR